MALKVERHRTIGQSEGKDTKFELWRVVVLIFDCVLSFEMKYIAMFLGVCETKAVLDLTLGSRCQHSGFKKYAVNFFIFSIFIFREMDFL